MRPRENLLLSCEGSRRHVKWQGAIAFLCAVLWLFATPSVSLAHAGVLRSDPGDQAVLYIAPQQVHLWFNESLDAALSSIVVVNDSNQGVERGTSLVTTDTGRILTIGLQPHLSAGTYTVVWQSASRQDGHVDTGTLLFTVARPDGTIPARTSRPYQQTPASSVPSSEVGQWIFTLLRYLEPSLQTLVLIFWIGGLCWFPLVLIPAREASGNQASLFQDIQRRWEQRLAPFLLLFLLLLQGGALISQAGTVLDDQGTLVFIPSVLATFITSTRAGLLWFVQLLLLLLAFQLAVYQQRCWRWQHTLHWSTALSWGNIFLGLAFLVLTLVRAQGVDHNITAETPLWILITLSGSFLHELAAILWIGSLLVLTMSCLPLLRKETAVLHAQALIRIGRFHTGWAWVGVGLMAVTGPLMITVHIPSWQEILLTPYGFVFALKMLLVGAVLLLSAYHIFYWRPCLLRSMARHATQSSLEVFSSTILPSIVFQAKQEEITLDRLLHRFHRLLLVEVVLSVGILLCAGILTVL